MTETKSDKTSQARFEEITCDLCAQALEGWPHNPHPFVGKVCCDWCNQILVVPARIKLHQRRRLPLQLAVGLAVGLALLAPAPADAASRCRTSRSGSTYYTTCEGGSEKSRCRTYQTGSTWRTTCD